jgi:thiosulfate dehydrogenase [quinone] large subunit
MARSATPWLPELPKLNLKAPVRATSLSEWALLPLRLFLGVTFTFASLQKLANPNFFNAASPASIQNQLKGAAQFSPIHALLHPMLPYAGTIGMVIAYAELAIGLGALLGLYSRIAALGGAVLSFSLFLTVSFHASPYYTGADIVFFFAWLPFIVAGSGPQLSLDGYLARYARAKKGIAASDLVAIPFAQVQLVCGKFKQNTCSALSGAACRSDVCPVLLGSQAPIATAVDLDVVKRRQVVLGGVTAAAVATTAVILGSTTAGLGKLIGGAKSPSAGNNLGGATGATGATGSGTLVGSAAKVPVGHAATVQLPGSGDPGIVIHVKEGEWLCYDTVCPHLGCTVSWTPGSAVLVCPCHGSMFDVASGGVIGGPASHGLRSLTVKDVGGNLYIQ